MPKSLVLAEKPSVARDLARVLGCTKNGDGCFIGSKYIVTWALGHLVTLADPESYDDKYKGGTKGAKGMQASDKRIPADLPKDITERIQFLAKETFRVLSCHGVSRVDFMVDASTNNVFVNEINTIPGSLSFYLWEATGIKFDELMDRLVQLALKRKREQGQKTTNFDQNIFSLGGGVKGAKGAKC